MNLKSLWREPSTKRGVVMFITGGAVLYQAVFGSGDVDVAGMESRIERWIGIGMMLAGLLGWLPDTQKEKANESTAADQTTPLPPIDLVGRSELSDSASQNHQIRQLLRGTRAHYSDDSVQSPSMSPIRSDEDGWNG